MRSTDLHEVKVVLLIVPVIFGHAVYCYSANELNQPVEYSKDKYLDFIEIAHKYGYYAEDHTVTTEDGYLLILYRMRNTTCQEFTTPVLLMHGLLLSSDTWLDSGPEEGLAYYLADNCYDLWVGNFRGNYLGRRHVRLNPDKDPEFWNFSFDEMGLYDVPATIDAVLALTQKETLNYIGYSQGGGTFAIMCSERPEYRLKVNTFIGLAPAIRMKFTRSIPFRVYSDLLSIFWKETKLLGIYEVLYRGSLLQRALAMICRLPGLLRDKLCVGVISLVDSYDPGSIQSETLRRLYTHFPAGTSVKNFIKYSQAVNKGTFQKFDYGREKNLVIYGNETAPFYNLKNLDMPSLLITGENDFIVDIRDVTSVHRQLKNSKLFVVNNEYWDHFDIPYSGYFPKLVFPVVHKQLLKYGGGGGGGRFQSFYFIK